MIFDYDMLRTLLDERPFAPHLIRTTGGNEHRVTHPEMLFLTRAVLVIVTDPDRGHVAIIPLPHISKIQQLPVEVH